MTRPLLILLITLGSNSFSLGQTETANNSPDIGFTVSVFIGVDCPVSQKYITKLNAIYTDYKNRPEIKWVFIVPGDVKQRKIKSFAKEYKILFPLKSDKPSQNVTGQTGATITPEVFIKRAGETLYRGAIDNWFYELGKYRQKATSNYLIDALESVLKNQEPEIKETTPIGCLIQQSSSQAHHQ